jgi:hypothetical protein
MNDRGIAYGREVVGKRLCMKARASVPKVVRVRSEADEILGKRLWLGEEEPVPVSTRFACLTRP